MSDMRKFIGILSLGAAVIFGISKIPSITALPSPLIPGGAAYGRRGAVENEHFTPSETNVCREACARPIIVPDKTLTNDLPLPTSDQLSKSFQPTFPHIPPHDHTGEIHIHNNAQEPLQDIKPINPKSPRTVPVTATSPVLENAADQVFEKGENEFIMRAPSFSKTSNSGSEEPGIEENVKVFGANHFGTMPDPIILKTPRGDVADLSFTPSEDPPSQLVVDNVHDFSRTPDSVESIALRYGKNTACGLECVDNQDSRNANGVNGLSQSPTKLKQQLVNSISNNCGENEVNSGTQFRGLGHLGNQCHCGRNTDEPPCQEDAFTGLNQSPTKQISDDPCQEDDGPQGLVHFSNRCNRGPNNNDEQPCEEDVSTSLNHSPTKPNQQVDLISDEPCQEDVGPWGLVHFSNRCNHGRNNDEQLCEEDVLNGVNHSPTDHNQQVNSIFGEPCE